MHCVAINNEIRQKNICSKLWQLEPHMSWWHCKSWSKWKQQKFHKNPNGQNWQNTTQENGDSLVSDGGTLTNLVVQLDVFSNVYKCNFNMMSRLATMVLEETKLNHKHWVLLQRKWILDHFGSFHWISDTWHEVEEKQVFVREKKTLPKDCSTL